MSRRKKSEFLKWREKHGVSMDDAAVQFEVCLKTIRNWDESGAPPLVMRLISFHHGGLSLFHPNWRGWKVSHTGKLWGPGGVWFTAEYLRHVKVWIDEYHRLKGSLHGQELERLRIRARMEAEGTYGRVLATARSEAESAPLIILP